jgi:hypothetical protein
MNVIDLREHDCHEHGLTLTQRVEEVAVDMQLAQRIRESLREQAMRIPFTEAELAAHDAAAFALADARMRSGA